MGSLRNPVGPLPSSIYWRRRAVLASVAALLALLAVWTVSSGGGKPGADGKGQGGSDPVTQITPGPSGSGPAISQAPGGRGESGTGGGTGTGTGADAGAGSAGAGPGKNGEPGSTPGSADGGAGTSGQNQVVPADSPVPTCAAGALQWEVKSVKNEYEANEKPRLELIARNVSGTTCKVDLGPKQAVLTITQASNAKPVWSSADCPTGAANVFFRVPSQGETKQSLEWDRHFSASTQCQSPPADVAAPDTYVVEVKSPGMPVARTSFVLKQN
ncbi:hypothetical protein J7E97_28530 [Streptomyces sp. ISL-66]|uniref:hypothetical protein n=1 Tax=Streptomyces sp. ISL-66 TaxID=2819186 RepID=UPI001BEC9943|nr:hypothetical protein [Streptomyces sp. ISL-66]MBT2471708.1 hypothetical protein [Streptomyces sp. ISL-66]